MSEQVHTTEQLDLQELKEEIIRKVMMLPDKDVTEMLEFVKALTQLKRTAQNGAVLFFTLSKPFLALHGS